MNHRFNSLLLIIVFSVMFGVLLFSGSAFAQDDPERVDVNKTLDNFDATVDTTNLGEGTLQVTVDVSGTPPSGNGAVFPYRHEMIVETEVGETKQGERIFLTPSTVNPYESSVTFYFTFKQENSVERDVDVKVREVETGTTDTEFISDVEVTGQSDRSNSRVLAEIRTVEVYRPLFDEKQIQSYRASEGGNNTYEDGTLPVKDKRTASGNVERFVSATNAGTDSAVVSADDTGRPLTVTTYTRGIITNQPQVLNIEYSLETDENVTVEVIDSGGNVVGPSYVLPADNDSVEQCTAGNETVLCTYKLDSNQTEYINTNGEAFVSYTGSSETKFRLAGQSVSSGDMKKTDTILNIGEPQDNEVTTGAIPSIKPFGAYDIRSGSVNRNQVSVSPGDNVQLNATLQNKGNEPITDEKFHVFNASSASYENTYFNSWDSDSGDFQSGEDEEFEESFSDTTGSNEYDPSELRIGGNITTRQGEFEITVENGNGESQTETFRGYDGEFEFVPDELDTEDDDYTITIKTQRTSGEKTPIVHEVTLEGKEVGSASDESFSVSNIGPGERYVINDEHDSDRMMFSMPDKQTRVTFTAVFMDKTEQVVVNVGNESAKPFASTGGPYEVKLKTDSMTRERSGEQHVIAAKNPGGSGNGAWNRVNKNVKETNDPDDPDTYRTYHTGVPDLSNVGNKYAYLKQSSFVDDPKRKLPKGDRSNWEIGYVRYNGVETTETVHARESTFQNEYDARIWVDREKLRTDEEYVPCGTAPNTCQDVYSTTLNDGFTGDGKIRLAGTNWMRASQVSDDQSIWGVQGTESAQNRSIYALKGEQDLNETYGGTWEPVEKVEVIRERNYSAEPRRQASEYDPGPEWNDTGETNDDDVPIWEAPSYDKLEVWRFEREITQPVYKYKRPQGTEIHKYDAPLYNVEIVWERDTGPRTTKDEWVGPNYEFNTNYQSEQVTFNASQSYGRSGKTIDTYKWYIDGTYVGSGETYTKRVSEEQKFDLTVEVVDSEGASSSETSVVSVSEGCVSDPCVASNTPQISINQVSRMVDYRYEQAAVEVQVNGSLTEEWTASLSDGSSLSDTFWQSDRIADKGETHVVYVNPRNHESVQRMLRPDNNFQMTQDENPPEVEEYGTTLGVSLKSESRESPASTTETNVRFCDPSYNGSKQRGGGPTKWSASSGETPRGNTKYLCRNLDTDLDGTTDEFDECPYDPIHENEGNCNEVVDPSDTERTPYAERVGVNNRGSTLDVSFEPKSITSGDDESTTMQITSSKYESYTVVVSTSRNNEAQIANRLEENETSNDTGYMGMRDGELLIEVNDGSRFPELSTNTMSDGTVTYDFTIKQDLKYGQDQTKLAKGKDVVAWFEDTQKSSGSNAKFTYTVDTTSVEPARVNYSGDNYYAYNVRIYEDDGKHNEQDLLKFFPSDEFKQADGGNSNNKIEKDVLLTKKEIQDQEALTENMIFNGSAISPGTYNYVVSVGNNTSQMSYDKASGYDNSNSERVQTDNPAEVTYTPETNDQINWTSYDDWLNEDEIDNSYVQPYGKSSYERSRNIKNQEDGKFGGLRVGYPLSSNDNRVAYYRLNEGTPIRADSTVVSANSNADAKLNPKAGNANDNDYYNVRQEQGVFGGYGYLLRENTGDIITLHSPQEDDDWNWNNIRHTNSELNDSVDNEYSVSFWYHPDSSTQFENYRAPADGPLFLAGQTEGVSNDKYKMNQHISANVRYTDYQSTKLDSPHVHATGWDGNIAESYAGDGDSTSSAFTPVAGSYWNHVVITTGSSGTEIYINGEKIAVSDSNNWNDEETMYMLLGGNPVTDRKGTETVPDSSNEWVERFSHGRIDEVVVYDEQLSGSEVDDEYVSRDEYNLTKREVDSSQTFTVSSDEEILESMYTEVGSSVTEKMEAKYKQGSWSEIEDHKVETQVKLYNTNKQLVGSYIVTIEPVRLDDGTIGCKETHEANIDGSGGEVSYVGGTVTLNSGTFTAEFRDANGNTQTTELVAADNAPSLSEQNVIFGIERPDSVERSGVTNSGCIYAEN